MVRVKNPLHVKKGDPKFGKPTKIMKKTGQSTYILQDGRKWNAIHLSLFPDSAAPGDITQPVPPTPANKVAPADSSLPVPLPGPTVRAQPQPRDNAQGRPQRVRKKPVWLKDCVP